MLAAAICSLGGMTFGYDLGALSGATQGLARTYSLSPALFGLSVSASLWGAVCASPIAGRMAGKLGRRGLLAACALLYTCAAATLALRAHWPWDVVLVLRFLSGAAVAGFVVVCPLYLAEISPRIWRGRFVGLFQIQIGVGVVVAFAVSAILARALPETSEWRWCFGLGAVPTVILLAVLRWVPEEPHWLGAQGRREAAEKSVSLLGLSADEWPRRDRPSASSPEMPSLPDRALPDPVLPDRLFSRKYLYPLLLATSVALFNQLCGVTILRVYLLDLLSGAGMGRELSHSYGFLIACLNVLALLLGMLVVDKLGRKPLLIAGSAGMSLCLMAFTFALRHHAASVRYLVILVAYNTFFASSQGAVAWVYISEIFPFAVRGKGQAYGALVHWIANAGLLWIYPVLEHVAPQANFLVFAAMMILQILVVVLWYPETRGTRLGAVFQVAES